MKILSWNIQNFTLSRILDPTDEVTKTRSREHLAYITTTVRETDPDVFLVFEVRCEQGPTAGVLANGLGVAGLEQLFVALRRLHGGWCLVPPLRVNPQAFDGALPLPTRSESVGVYWRADRLTFTGPWVWPAGSPNGPPAEPGAGMAVTYPVGIDGVFVPAGTTAAPRLDWTSPAGPIFFTEPHDRRPLQVSFAEIPPAGNRTINILAVHPSPARAIKALKPLQDLMWGVAAPKPGELTVAAGDINVNLLSAGLDRQQAIAMVEMANVYARVPPNPLVGTIIRRGAAAEPANYNSNRCVDYGWVRYTRTAPPIAGAPTARAIDRVSGAPATAPFPAITSHMFRKLPQIALIADVNRRNRQFRLSWNYGHIGPLAAGDGTSDHLPVLLYL